MPAFFDRMLRAGEGRQLRELEKLVKLVNAEEERISALSDQDLRNQTSIFRSRLDQGETLDDL